MTLGKHATGTCKTVVPGPMLKKYVVVTSVEWSMLSIRIFDCWLTGTFTVTVAVGAWSGRLRLAVVPAHEFVNGGGTLT